jgi:hypothetical protein
MGKEAGPKVYRQAGKTDQYHVSGAHALTRPSQTLLGSSISSIQKGTCVESKQAKQLVLSSFVPGQQ